MKHAELVAQQILGLLRPDATIRPIAVQSDGEHDLELLDPDGHVFGIVEVTTAADQRVLATHAAIKAPRLGGQIIKRTQSKRTWYITPAFNCRLNDLRRGADQHLLDIEARGITQFTKIDDPSQTCDQLHLEYGHMSPKDSGEIILGFPGSGAYVSSSNTVLAIEAEANKPDNHRKLATHLGPLSVTCLFL